MNDVGAGGINTLYVGLDMDPKKTDGYHDANSTIVKRWTPGKEGRGLLHDGSFFPLGFDAPVCGWCWIYFHLFVDLLELIFLLELDANFSGCGGV